jgi:hypothetical protein
MRIGWLADIAQYIGGAELTQAEFKAAAPEDVEIVLCPPGNVDTTCDRYAIHNCVDYTAAELAIIKDRPAVKYWNDVGSWVRPDRMEQLEKHATPIFCSPLQAEYMGHKDAVCIPPPVNLARFEQAAATVNGNRQGVVSVGSWRNLGKAPHRVAEWAQREGVPVDFFGDGPFAPNVSRPVPYMDMPALLASYQTFVFLPSVIEPFGRTVAEAWAAGCEIVTNGLVGARYWIEEKPEAIETAAADFWEVLLSCGS